MSAAKAYFKALYTLGHGSPLWIPESAASPLDVGFLHQGGFFRLFNASLPADHPLQVNGVPDGFEPLVIPPILRVLHSNFFNPMVLHSSSVKSTEINAGVTSDWVSAGAGIRFQCSQEHGAVLITKETSTREDVLDNGFTRRYIRKHVDSWYDFAGAHGFLLREGEIMMVQGVDRTDEWALAAFTERRHDSGIFFQGGYTAVGGVKLSVQGSWNTLTSVEHRSGPSASRNSQRLADTAGPSWPEVQDRAPDPLQQGDARPRTPGPTRDQCIFLRSWHVRRRRFGAPPKITAAAEEQQDWPDRDDLYPADPLLSNDSDDDGSIIITTSPVETYEPHPSAAILEWILTNSEAEVAVATDDDLARFNSWPGQADQVELDTEVAQNVIVHADGTGPVYFSSADDPPLSALKSLDAVATSSANRFATFVDSPNPPLEDTFERRPPVHNDKPMIEAVPSKAHSLSERRESRKSVHAVNWPERDRRIRGINHMRAVEAERRAQVYKTPASLGVSDTVWIPVCGNEPDEVAIGSEQAVSARRQPTVASFVTSKPVVERARNGSLGEGTWRRHHLGLSAATGEILAVRQMKTSRRARGKTVAHRRSPIAAMRANVKMLRDLSHPHILRYLGAGMTRRSSQTFIDYLPVGTLETCVRGQGKFNEQVTKWFTSQILGGLGYLHSKGIILGDIDADRVLVDTTGTCRISDWGFWKSAEETSASGAMATMSSPVIWMAPELVRTGHQTSKVDIWSAACIVLEMWTGQSPWGDEDVATVRSKLRSEEACPPVLADAALSPLAEAFRARCFAMDPDERPSASELSDDPYLKISPEWKFSGNLA